MTSTQRDAISSPAEGLMIYNRTTESLQFNSGTPAQPNWYNTSDGLYSASNAVNCDANGFEGTYVNSGALTASEKFTVTITNNGYTNSDVTFLTGDLVLSGISGVTVNSVSPSSATILVGASQVVEYGLTGTPGSSGTLTGIWTNVGLTCTKTVDVINGAASFSLPITSIRVSTFDASQSADFQGVVDNASNQLTIDIPYTSGVGGYEAYTGTYVINNTGTGEGGDANSFRLTYPAGTFSSSGSITATIEVDGDGSFNVEKQLFGAQETLASLDFQVNGSSQGTINLDVAGGIPDKNFADADHKFIYL